MTESSPNHDLAFREGSVVAFKTVHGVQVQGQVICFEPTLKILAMRDKDSVTGKDVMRVYNAQMITAVRLVTTNEKATKVHNSSYVSSSKKIPERMAALSETRSHEIMVVDNVPLSGQQAFLQLKRTISNTRWDGPNIRVVGLVLVSAPYTGENAEILQTEIHSESDESKARIALAQVKKILSKPFSLEDLGRADFTVSL